MYEENIAIAAKTQKVSYVNVGKINYVVFQVQTQFKISEENQWK